MKHALTLTFALMVYSSSAANPLLDEFYRDVLVALKHNCADSYPDLKPMIGQSVNDFITTNADVLSSDYLEKIMDETAGQSQYTREQCIGMAQLPQEPMMELFKRAAQEREDEMRRRGEYERANH